MCVDLPNFELNLRTLCFVMALVSFQIEVVGACVGSIGLLFAPKHAILMQYTRR